MPISKPLSRRDFIQLCAVGLGSVSLPVDQIHTVLTGNMWPILRFDSIPGPAQDILILVPETIIARDGNLYLMGSENHPAGRVTLAQTQWNLENTHRVDRLHSNVPWGIVLHWFGDKENFNPTVQGYLRGFNSLRQIDDYETRTSAHFLIGNDFPRISADANDKSIGIIQTQKPDKDGTPFVSSHVSGLDYKAHRARRQYFVRALYQLEFEEPGVHSVLQDWFDRGRLIDPNMRTIAIEWTGYNFENRSHFPSKQQIANTISVIWAVMQRYNITSNNLFGHHELQLNKSDPGKKFMGMIRYLIGIKALLENDPSMNYLVFGNFLGEGTNTFQAVQKYFDFVYNHLLMVSKPNRVYEWEALSGYWFLSDLLGIQQNAVTISRRFLPPLQSTYSSPGKLFTQPKNHEGVDLYNASEQLQSGDKFQVNLVANGVCIYLGDSTGCSGGKSVIFRHRQQNGCQVLSVYGHLDHLSDLKVGKEYPIRFPIGDIEKSHKHIEPFLHFAMGYGGTWLTDLKKRPSIPKNVGASWIRERYMNPLNLMSGNLGSSPGKHIVS